jgi:two-component system response regulator FixJ
LETVQKALSLAAGNAHQDAQADVIQGRLDQLTKREREIFDFLVAGMHSKTIASKFDLSPRTVEVHRAHIIEKMKAKTLSNLIRMGLILSFGNAAAKRL